MSPLRNTTPRLASSIALVAMALGPNAVPAQDPTPAGVMLRAHAHNDYEHPKPLQDALARGFMSVEADIHLVDGALLVAHDRDQCTPERTLRALYLQPLADRVKAQGGRVHRDGPLEFQLLIDFKTGGAATYDALRRELADFRPMLSHFARSPRHRGAALVVLSGAAPAETVLADTDRLCALDGWFDDARGSSPDEYPLLSANWTRHFLWNGIKPMPDDQRRRLHSMVAEAHALGRRVRFWATADRPALWRELLLAGADWINIDDLEQARTHWTGSQADRLWHRAAVDRLLDDRYGDPAATDRLAQRLSDDGLDAKAVEAIVRAPRATLSPPADLPTNRLIAKVPLTCEHVDYETTMLLFVPHNIDRPVPLVIIGHGGNGAMDADYAQRAAAGGTAPWIEQARRHKFILAAPLTERGWGAIGNSILLTAISKLKRWYPIDPDRVHVTGHSMGGHLTWRTALNMGDRFGGLVPMSGGYDYVERGQLQRLWNSAGYATFGSTEPYGIADDNRRMRDWLKDKSYRWTLVEKDGGHEIFADEMPKVADFIIANPRNPYPQSVRFQGGKTLEWDSPGANPKWNQEHTWNPERPIRQSISHWLHPHANPDLAEKTIQQAFATIDNTARHVEITTNQVRGLTLHLHPRMLDLDQPIEVSINGETAYTGTIQPDIATLLATVRAFDDRGRIYHAALGLPVTTDHPVPEPR